MTRPRLLDLFCGAGGAAMGYHRAGFDVVGIDNQPQPSYPFEFHQADALYYLIYHGHKFDAIHASPPCQGYSTATADPDRHPRLIPATRALLAMHAHIPWVIENVEGARRHMDNPVKLCGSNFGLKVQRHRYFESNRLIMARGLCAHAGTPVGVYGAHFDSREHMRPDGTRRGAKAGSLEEGRQAMGIDWMSWPELVQAIPPAYTEFIGAQLLDQLITTSDTA